MKDIYREHMRHCVYDAMEVAEETEAELELTPVAMGLFQMRMRDLSKERHRQESTPYPDEDDREVR